MMFVTGASRLCKEAIVLRAKKKQELFFFLMLSFLSPSRVSKTIELTFEKRKPKGEAHTNKKRDTSDSRVFFLFSTQNRGQCRRNRSVEEKKKRLLSVGKCCLTKKKNNKFINYKKKKQNTHTHTQKKRQTNNKGGLSTLKKKKKTKRRKTKELEN